MKHLFAKKPLHLLLQQADESEKGLRRTLNSWNLMAIGVGAIIGAGLFVRTAAAAANNAGPSVTIAYIVAAIGCVLAGLCYAEFASMIPVAGSAYTYSYATMGELIAWIIGWDLILEYALGAATVAIAWSEYLNKLLNYIGVNIPYEWCHSPLQKLLDDSGNVIASGIMNVPALTIVFLLTLLLVRGTRESAFVNALIVILKLPLFFFLFSLDGLSSIHSITHLIFQVLQFTLILMAYLIILAGYAEFWVLPALCFLHSLALMLFPQPPRKPKIQNAICPLAFWDRL
jgi:APA family basic amino acid/polyamine antiporter